MRARYITTVLLLGFALIYAIIQAAEPDPSRLHFKVEGDRAYGYGTSDKWSYGYVGRFMRKNPEVKTLVLKRMPGTVDGDDNMRIARKIRKKGLHTHLEADSFIASGAVDLFLAGSRRTMECGARIGVHSWTFGKVFHPEEMGVDIRQQTHEKFLKDMGIDPKFYAFTRDAALPDQIHILTVDEINRFGLVSEPLSCAG